MAFQTLPHHLAWLSAHPERDQRWLQDRISDGFDIHHLDGDHENNDPDNLILIEAVDHQRLHGRRVRFHDRSAKRLATLAEGERAYYMRWQNVSWSGIAFTIWGDRHKKSRAQYVANLWARENGLMMPTFC